MNGNDNKKEERAVIRNIKKAVNESSIPMMIRIGYTLADASRLVNEQAFQRLRAVYRSHGIDCGDNDLLKGLNEYCRAVKSERFQFERYVEPLVQKGSETEDGFNSRLYDYNNAWASMVAYLTHLFIDRAKDEQTMNRILEFIEALPSQEIFTREDLERFD